MDFLTSVYLLLPIVITIMVGVLLLAFLTSIVGLINAWFGDVEIAKWIGWGTAVPGGILGILVGVAVVAFDPDVPTFPWICMIPVVMGALTLAHVYAVRVPGNVSRYQFTMPTILYVMLLTGLFGVGVRLWMADYTDYSMRDEFEANLQRSDQIENVNGIGHVVNDRFYVEEIEFSLAGRPDTLVRMYANPQLQRGDLDEPLPSIGLIRVGRWNLCGKMQDAYGRWHDMRGLTIGPQGRLGDRIPFPISNFNEIVTNYDKLVETLEQWPRHDRPEKLIHHEAIEYWVEEAPLPRPNDP